MMIMAEEAKEVMKAEEVRDHEAEAVMMITMMIVVVEAEVVTDADGMVTMKVIQKLQNADGKIVAVAAVAVMKMMTMIVVEVVAEAVVEAVVEKDVVDGLVILKAIQKQQSRDGKIAVVPAEEEVAADAEEGNILKLSFDL